MDGSLVYKVSEKDGNAYVVATSTLALEEEFNELLREFAFSRVRIASDDKVGIYLESISKEIEELDSKIKDVDIKIRDFKKYLKDLYIYQAYIINCRRKEASSENFLKTRQMNIIEGYIPADKSNDFNEKLTEVLKDKYILDLIPADKDDPNVPIILENNKLIEPYESVVETYALPKYSELDPTPLIAPFYTIFTGFMIGDLGYGLLGVIGILLALKLQLFPKDKEKILKLFLRISISACVFGFLFGSVLEE